MWYMQHLIFDTHPQAFTGIKLIGGINTPSIILYKFSMWWVYKLVFIKIQATYNYVWLLS